MSMVGRTLGAGSAMEITRRSLLRGAGASVAGMWLAPDSPEAAQGSNTTTTTRTMSTSFASLRQVNAGLLNVGYAEAGHPDGVPVVLLHGWPYDIHSFVDVAPLLASAGYRVIVPYLRGYGTTRFLSDATVRNGQPSTIAVDTIALMDALKIEKATFGAFDWGARTANIIAALWPERCNAMVSVSGYLIGGQEAGKMPLPPRAGCNGGISSISRPSVAARVTTSTVMISRS
jgi:pimeloyl-ACP methyl ester carboxylesterase